MVSPNFESQMSSGGGDAAYIWHPAGMPFACTTSTELADALRMSKGTISGATNPGLGNVNITCAAAHGLSATDIVIINDTTSYNGTSTGVTIVSPTVFQITETWVASETGTWRACSPDALGYRQELFGSTTPSVGDYGGYPLCVDVAIVPTLHEDMSDQTISYSESKGLDVGGWSVTINKEPSISYNYRESAGDTPGGIYPGLDMVEDSGYDGSIPTWSLDANFNSSTLTGYSEDSNLYDLIVANQAAGYPTYVWAGSSCIACYAAADVGGGVYTATAFTQAHASVPETLFKKSFDSANVLVANAPTSIVGLPGRLWLVPMRDGTIQDIATAAPILDRGGPISNNPRGDAGTWKIQHRGWLDWLDQDIPATTFTGHLQGFRFTQQIDYPTGDPDEGYDSAQDNDLTIREWDGGAAYQNISINILQNGIVSAFADAGGGQVTVTSAAHLLTENARVRITRTANYDERYIATNVTANTFEIAATWAGTEAGAFFEYARTFESRADIIEAVAPFLSGSVRLTAHDYVINNGQSLGGTLLCQGQHTAKDSFCWGRLCWILGFGMPNALTWADTRDDARRGVGYWQCGGLNAAYEGMTADSVGGDVRFIQGITSGGTTYGGPQDLADDVFLPMSAPPTLCDYYYQFNWDIDDAMRSGWNQGWQVPQHSGGGTWTNRLFLGPGVLGCAGLDKGFPIPLDTINGDYRLTVSDSADVTTLSDGTPVRFGNRDTNWELKYTSGVLSQLIDGSPATNYFLTDATGVANTWNGDGAHPVLKIFQGDISDTSDVTALHAYGSTVWGMDLYYCPMVHAYTDPWEITQTNTIENTNFVKLWKGLFNLTGGADIPERQQITNIPDLIEDANGQREMIDWSKLDQLAQAAFPDAFFSVPMDGGNINVKKLFLTTLTSLGIRPIWEYCEDQRSWRMSFDTFGVVSPPLALAQGRVIKTTGLGASIQAEHTREVHGNAWLYHNVSVEWNANGSGFKNKLRYNNTGGRAMVASGGRTLEIKDKCLNIDQESAEAILYSRMSDILRYVNIATPTITTKITPAAWARVGAGVGVLLTNDDMRNTYTGAMGLSQVPAMITKMTIGQDETRITARLADSTPLGISPSMDLAAARLAITGDVVSVTGLSTDPDDNEYANPLNGLIDLATFGCINYSPATDAIEQRVCDCATGYAVTILEANSTSYDTAGVGRNVFDGILKGWATDTLLVDDINNGRCKIEILADEGEFDAGVDHIVIFADRDSANLVDCQLVYGWFGDEEGMVTDSTAATHKAMVMV